ncbi:hypothetical protein [Paraburkholderia sp. Clong3]|uniref:hypothetical protein n=1 Tax=Paraburkholderia sp. Clong3 TaxID=2991061 RepID=UPI003D1E7D59
MVHTLNGDSRVDEPSRLNRYQRTLVMGAGVAVSFVLVLLTGVVLKSTVTDYVEDRYTDSLSGRLACSWSFSSGKER